MTTGAGRRSLVDPIGTVAAIGTRRMTMLVDERGVMTGERRRQRTKAETVVRTAVVTTEVATTEVVTTEDVKSEGVRTEAVTTEVIEHVTSEAVAAVVMRGLSVLSVLIGTAELIVERRRRSAEAKGKKGPAIEIESVMTEIEKQMTEIEKQMTEIEKQTLANEKKTAVAPTRRGSAVVSESAAASDADEQC